MTLLLKGGTVVDPSQDIDQEKQDILIEDGVVVDIGLATAQLTSALEDLMYTNLDEDPTFSGKNTTTEVLARFVFDRLAKAVRVGDLGERGRGITAICVTLRESHLAWGSYEGSL